MYNNNYRSNYRKCQIILYLFCLDITYASEVYSPNRFFRENITVLIRAAMSKV